MSSAKKRSTWLSQAAEVGAKRTCRTSYGSTWSCEWRRCPYDVDLEIGRHVGLDVIEEFAERAGAVALGALADDRAGGDIEGCEQRGRAVPVRVMGAPLGFTGPHRHERLGAK